MIITEEDYIQHFGVKGMRWGVRKDKPVSVEKMAKREAKAQKYVAKSHILQTKINELSQKNPRNPYSRQRIQEKQAKLISKKQEADMAAEAKRQGKLTDKQRKLLKGAAGAAVVLAAYGTYTSIQSGNVNRLATKGKVFLGLKDSPWKTDLSLADKDMSVDGLMSNVVSKINPGYGAAGTKVNCRRATFAYEMRRRGHDVSATRTNTGRGQTVVGIVNATSPGEKIKRSGQTSVFAKIIQEGRNKDLGKTTETPFTDAVSLFGSTGKNKIESGTVLEALSSQPDGARGELGMLWRGGGGHSMAWEVVKGKAVIFDTQSGKKYASESEVNEFAKNIAEAGFTRLDNLSLNEDFLTRWLKDAG